MDITNKGKYLCIHIHFEVISFVIVIFNPNTKLTSYIMSQLFSEPKSIL